MSDSFGALVMELVAVGLQRDVSSIDATVPVHTLGIDSLVAADMARRLSARVGLPISMTTFLGDLSLEQITGSLSKHPTDNSVYKEANSQSKSLSNGQLALWAIQQNAPQSSAYNLAYALKTNTKIDVEAMRRAVVLLVTRHKCLRTVFPIESGKPYAIIQDTYDLDFLDEAVLPEALSVEASEPFDLASGPLFRFRIYKTNPDVVLFVVHHIIVDFWSITILLRDLFHFYSCELRNVPPELPQLQASYADFVSRRTHYLEGPTGETDWQYWKQTLAGQLRPLELVTDRPRPSQLTYRGAVHSFLLDSKTTQDLRALSRSTASTLFVTVLSAYFAFLYRITGQDDLIVGVPTSGRDRQEWLDLVGYFVNTVALRMSFDDDPSGRILTTRARRTVLRAMNHQNFPFSSLAERLRLKRDPSRSPIFQSMFVWQTQASGVSEVPAALALGTDGVRFTLNSMDLETVSTGCESAQCDLSLLVAELDDTLSFSLKYSTDLFDSDTAARMGDHFIKILGEMGRNPDSPVSALPM